MLLIIRSLIFAVTAGYKGHVVLSANEGKVTFLELTFFNTVC